MRSYGKKWSEFNKVQSISGTASVCIVEGGQNVTISVSDFAQQFGLADIRTQGNGVPILDQAGAQYNIRAIEATGGLSLSVGPTNNIQLSTAIENTSEGGAKIFVDDTAVPLVARAIEGSGGIVVTQAGGTITISGNIIPTPTKTKLVNDVNDFPAPVGGEIQLAGDTDYELGDTIDIGSLKFRSGDNTVMSAQSVLIGGIISSTSDTLFSSSTGSSISLNNMFIDAPNAQIFDFDSPTAKTGVFALSEVNIANCASMGRVNNYQTFLIRLLRLENSAGDGIEIQGDLSVMNIDSVFVGNFDGTMFDLNGSVTDVINIENVTVVSNNPSNLVLDGLPNSGNISPTGTGTFRNINIINPYTSSGNILPSDLRWEFSVSNVVPESQNIALATLTNNTLATPVSNGVFALMSGVFTQAVESRFSIDQASGRITYIGNKDILVDAGATFSAVKSGGGEDDYTVAIFKNDAPLTGAQIGLTLYDGGNVGSSAITTVTQMSTGDYLNLYVRGDGTGDDVTFSNVNFKVSGA